MGMDTKTALLNSVERAARRLGVDEFSYAFWPKRLASEKQLFATITPAKRIFL